LFRRVAASFNKGEQMVRYYGYYSNVSRGKRKKSEQDKRIPYILEPDGTPQEYRKNWARLITTIVILILPNMIVDYKF
jgi:hypothetical protein